VSPATLVDASKADVGSLLNTYSASVLGGSQSLRLRSLMAAITAQDEDLVEKLLDWGVDPNAADNEGLTPFRLAVKRSDSDMALLLLERGVDINFKDGQGRTALHTAILTGNWNMMEFLANARADLDAADDEERTALWMAAEVGREKMAVFLLESGASDTILNVEQIGLGHWTISHGRWTISDYLLAHGHKVDVASTQSMGFDEGN